MSESKIHFFKNPAQPSEPEDRLGLENRLGQGNSAKPETPRLEPSTCVEAETFALRVLDDSMEPEFRQNCIIVIDPTGHAKDGSYVLANKPGREKDLTATVNDAEEALEPVLFRQLRRVDDVSWQLCALNERFESEITASDFSDIIGVIVQRAGIRRRYHKHYS